MPPPPPTTTMPSKSPRFQRRSDRVGHPLYPRRRRRRHLGRSSSPTQLFGWLRGVASPESVVLVLVVWFMLALSLHVLLADDDDGAAVRPDDGGRGDWQSRELLALQKIRQGASGGLRDRNENRHHRRGRRHYDQNHKNQDDFGDALVGNHQPKRKKAPLVSKRQAFEQDHPPTNTTRIRDFVASLRDADLDEKIAQIGGAHHETNDKLSSSLLLLDYDPMDCPDTPPPGYPVHYSLIKVLEEWPVDELQWPTEEALDGNDDILHPYLFHSICVFDWDKPQHRERAKSYQIDHDLPFVIRNHPEFLATAERWMRHDPAYLQSLIQDNPQRTEHSTNNHLPFWRDGGGRRAEGWVPPTENVEMTFAEWHKKATALDRAMANGKDHTKMDHWYFRLNGESHHHSFLYEELPVFDPDQFEAGENIFMWEPDNARGINCRWGMAGNTAEAHYDAGRNWIVLLGGGQRRYILAHPQQCPHLALYRIPHPSARHSQADWSEIGKAAGNGEAGRMLANAQVFQVVLQSSDALFLPTHWFHFSEYIPLLSLVPQHHIRFDSAIHGILLTRLFVLNASKQLYRSIAITNAMHGLERRIRTVPTLRTAAFQCNVPWMQPKACRGQFRSRPQRIPDLDGSLLLVGTEQTAEGNIVGAANVVYVVQDTVWVDSTTITPATLWTTLGKMYNTLKR